MRPVYCLNIQVLLKSTQMDRFVGGWWFLGGRAERTDWCLPVAGGGACTWGRRGGGGETGEGSETGFPGLFPKWSSKSWHFLFICDYIFSSLCPPLLYLPSLPRSPSPHHLAVVQHPMLLPLVVWRTNSSSYLQDLLTTQQVNGDSVHQLVES